MHTHCCTRRESSITVRTMDADLAVNRAEGWKTPAPGFGSAKGTIAVDMDDVLWWVCVFRT